MAGTAAQGLNGDTPPAVCQGCKTTGDIPAFTMAFQPIVSLTSGLSPTIWGYEALVRGEAGEGAPAVLAQVTEETVYQFDQACRVRAIEIAGALGLDAVTKLSINFMPNAVYEPAACIKASLAAAKRAGLRADQLMFEFTETERFADIGHVANIIARYRQMGMVTALDDFGSGYSGLVRLAGLHPDLLKIDIGLVRGIDTDPRRRAIVGAVLALAGELDIRVIAEGVETEGECRTLSAAGVDLFQGFYFGHPQIGALPRLKLNA